MACPQWGSATAALCLILAVSIMGRGDTAAVRVFPQTAGAVLVRGGTYRISYPPNLLGLHDMAGNVWEFALDEWKPGYAAGPQSNPNLSGPLPGALASVQGRRGLRGGSFGGAAVNWRTRWRDCHEVHNAVAFVGFRCAYPG